MKTKEAMLEVNRLRMSIEFCGESEHPTPGGGSRHEGIRSKDKLSIDERPKDRDLLFVEAWLDKVIRRELAEALVQAEREFKRKAKVSVAIDSAIVLRRALRIRVTR